MAIKILSGNSTDELSVDPVSKAARVTAYNADGSSVDSLTDAQLRATPLPVSITSDIQIGAIEIKNGTDDTRATVTPQNALKVDSSAVTQPVSGVFFQATQPVSSATLPLPSGASTSANQLPNNHQVVANAGTNLNTSTLSLEATQALVKAKTDNLDVLLSTRASSAKQLPDNHQVSVSNFPATQSVSVLAIAPDLAALPLTASGITRFQNTTTPLASGATFTGSQWEPVIGFSNITVNVDSNRIGTLTVEFSQDGTNVTTSVSRNFISINSGQSYTFVPATQFARVKFTNTDSLIQTFIRLQTIFKSYPVGAIFAPVNTPLSPISLSQIVVSVPNDGVKTTYSAAVASLVADNLATDIFTITGSATKVIRITAVFLSATQTTASTAVLSIIRRSTANTGGVSTALSATTHDTNNVAATATLAAYTTNPTILGTLVGSVRARKVFVPSTTTPVEGGFSEWTFGDRPAQAIVLRGISQSVSINLGGATLSGSNFSIAIEFTEE